MYVRSLGYLGSVHTMQDVTLNSVSIVIVLIVTVHTYVPGITSSSNNVGSRVVTGWL